MFGKLLINTCITVTEKVNYIFVTNNIFNIKVQCCGKCFKESLVSKKKEIVLTP